MSCVVMSLGDCVMCCPGVARPVCHVLPWCCQVVVSCCHVLSCCFQDCVSCSCQARVSCVVLLLPGMCVMCCTVVARLLCHVLSCCCQAPVSCVVMLLPGLCQLLFTLLTSYNHTDVQDRATLYYSLVTMATQSKVRQMY